MYNVYIHTSLEIQLPSYYTYMYNVYIHTSLEIHLKTKQVFYSNVNAFFMYNNKQNDILFIFRIILPD